VGKELTEAFDIERCGGKEKEGIAGKEGGQSTW